MLFGSYDLGVDVNSLFFVIFRPILGVLTGLYGSDSGFLCSITAEGDIILDLCIVVGILVYFIWHYHMIAKILVQQAKDIGMEDMVNVRQMYKYPIIMFILWAPIWIELLLSTFGVISFTWYVLAVIGVHLQGAVNGIFYLRQNRQSLITPKMKETLETSLDEINFDNTPTYSDKPFNEEEARKRLELALKF